MLKKVFIFLFFFLFVAKANAFVIIEDEETKNYLATLIKPIYKTSQIPFDENKVHLILDDSTNAFVISGGHMFVHTGLILRAKNSNELSGVFAHEAGHIKAGHIFKHKLKIKEMQTVSLVSMLLAGLAGAASGSGEVALAGVYGTQGILTGQMLEYKKEDERAADSFAFEVLKKNNIPNQDLINFLKRLQKEHQLSGVSERSYYTTHPLTIERINFLKNQETTSYAYEDKKLNHIQAKLNAFILKPKETIKKYQNNNYAMAIAMFKALKIKEALYYVDALIKKEPNNPYYHELKAQIYSETAQPNKAIISYQKALELLPDSNYFKVYLAANIIEAKEDEKSLEKAVLLLKQANAKYKKPNNYLLLARAYGKLGDDENALISSAEYSLARGDIKLAKKQAKKAKENTSNPKIIIKADDILTIKD